MPGQILVKRNGRNIVYRDRIGLLHQCKGYLSNERAPIFWTLCHGDVAAEELRPQARGETLTCPDCRRAASRPARRILAAAALQSRWAVGGLPFKPELE